jgi:hypothetical protein
MSVNSLAEFMRVSPLLTRAWWVGAISTIALSLLMMPHLEGYNILALQFSFSQEQFLAVLSGMTAEQQHGFGMHYRYDFAYPVAYGLWMSCTVAWLLDRADGSDLLNAVVYFPMLAAVFDLLENSFIVPYALDFSQVTDTAVYWQSVNASLKYGLLGIAALVMLSLVPKAFKKG